MASSRRSPVRNPLTLMAVFAGLAEVAATVALPRLHGHVQTIFALFTVGFPLSIVLPFFFFLWYRPQNLYAPGDYRQDPAHLTSAYLPAPVSPDKKKSKAKIPRSKKQPSAENEI